MIFHDEELNDVYRSHSIVRIAKSSQLRLDAHVARVKETCNTLKRLVVKTSFWKTKNEMEVFSRSPV
jgi:hypothetical protein